MLYLMKYCYEIWSNSLCSLWSIAVITATWSKINSHHMRSILHSNSYFIHAVYFINSTRNLFHWKNLTWITSEVLSWRAARDSAYRCAQIAWLVDPICKQIRYPTHRSSLKTVHRTVFLTLRPSQGSSPLYYFKIKQTPKRVSVLFGALQGTRTPDLLVRSQSLYPAELAAHFLCSIILAQTR